MRCRLEIAMPQATQTGSRPTLKYVTYPYQHSNGKPGFSGTYIYLADIRKSSLDNFINHWQPETVDETGNTDTTETMADNVKILTANQMLRPLRVQISAEN